MQATIKRIIPQTDDVSIFWLGLESQLHYKPGQYLMFAFPDIPKDKHAFSIVKYDPENQEVMIIVKKHREFTSQLLEKKPGQHMLVFGPYGRFTLESDTDAVFIAGGIGITPLFSMLEYLSTHDNSIRATLFYSTRTREEMVLLEELEKFADARITKQYRFTAEYPRRFSGDDIEEVVPDLYEQIFYICGPPAMIEDLRGQLIAKGVPEDRIRSERFH